MKSKLTVISIFVLAVVVIVVLEFQVTDLWRTMDTLKNNSALEHQVESLLASVDELEVQVRVLQKRNSTVILHATHTDHDAGEKERNVFKLIETHVGVPFGD